MIERPALIDYRLTQARESLLEADVLMKSGMSCRSVMNRLYYAMFYAVLALLQEKQVGASKHSGAFALFDREFPSATTPERVKFVKFMMLVAGDGAISGKFLRNEFMEGINQGE